MKKLLLPALLAIATASFSQTEVLVWSDEFDGTGLPDAANWGYDIGGNGWGNNEVQYYTNSVANAFQSGGSLFIKAIKSGGSWTSARLLSKGKKEFKYGRIVFRAKLPSGSGTWPANWMLGANIGSVGWPACGEVDVMEHVGKNPTVVQCALHTPSSNGNTVNKKEKSLADCETAFHEYEVNWTPQKMAFAVDGFVYYTYAPAVKNASTWPFDLPQFLILNLAMGGNLGSDPQYETGGLKNGIDPALTSATMEIDWVRVFQLVTPTVEAAPDNGSWPDGLRLSPNPAPGRCSAFLPDGKTASLLLVNAAGAIVFEKKLTQKETELDFSALPKGVYFSRIQMENMIYSGTVVVQ